LAARLLRVMAKGGGTVGQGGLRSAARRHRQLFPAPIRVRARVKQRPLEQLSG